MRVFSDDSVFPRTSHTHATHSVAPSQSCRHAARGGVCGHHPRWTEGGQGRPVHHRSVDGDSGAGPLPSLSWGGLHPDAGRRWVLPVRSHTPFACPWGSVIDRPRISRLQRATLSTQDNVKGTCTRDQTLWSSVQPHTHIQASPMRRPPPYTQ